MKYKLLGLAVTVLFVLALTAGMGTASDGEVPDVKGSLTYDPVTLHANVIDLAGAEEIQIYFRYRERGQKEWTETEKKEMTTEGKYSRVVDDIDLDKKYEFEVVVVWEGDKIVTFTTEPHPAEFKFSNLRAEPEQLYIEDYTTLKVDVENIGGQKGDTTVDFVVDGTILSQEVELEAGEKKTVSVRYTPDEIGEYEVKSSDKSTSFEVFELPSVRAKAVDDITHNSALLVAELENMGLEDGIDVYFKYRSEDGDWMKTPRETMDSTGEFSRRVENLKPDTNYEFKAVGVWDDKRYTTQERFDESRTIPVEPKVFVEESTRGVNDIGIFFWGEGKSLGHEITEYRWDFYGDGEWDYVSNETGRTVYAYSETGRHEAVFEVEDSEGKTDSATMDVLVRERTQPIYEIEEKSRNVGRDVYFHTEYRYDDREDETTISMNIINRADEKRFVSVLIDFPKEAVGSVEDMNMFPGPTEILKENPTVRWNFTMPADGTGRIEVSTDGHIEVHKFDDMKMVQAYGEEPEVRNIWGFVIFLFVVAAIVFLIANNWEEGFALGSGDSENGDKDGKKELDRKFMDAARKVKRAVKRNEIENPKGVVNRLELANEALENGNIGKFQHYLDSVEDQVECGNINRNVVW